MHPGAEELPCGLAYGTFVHNRPPAAFTLVIFPFRGCIGRSWAPETHHSLAPLKSQLERAEWHMKGFRDVLLTSGS